MRYCVMVHGGVTTQLSKVGGCIQAADRAEKILAEGGSALDAVVAATVVLEDDPNYNAGTGSTPQLDGECEMDAGVMTSERKIGVVIAIRRVKNPILVARAVMEKTNHVILASEGATAFARKMGFPDYNPLTEHRRKRLEQFKAKLGKIKNPTYEDYLRILDETDTVGVVTLDSEGRFATANSTGGVSLKLPGRVGDSPIVGAGFYAGPAAAVVTTGVGEEIIRRIAAKEVYDLIAAGKSPQEACEEETASFTQKIVFGVMAVTREASGWAANRDMPVVVRKAD